MKRSRTPGRQVGSSRRVFVDTGVYAVERISEDDERRAVETIKRHADKSYSLCDASSFVVMERLKMSDAMSFDEDFRTYGRIVVHPVE